VSSVVKGISLARPRPANKSMQPTDGREEWVIPRLNEEQRRYPIRSIVNDTLLVERALSGWTSDLDT
jgi:hypothetical protein